ncbi:MAG: lactate utilization protein [Methanoregula sp.]|jgi:L-lactate utilization protein LutB|uniref:lactate utilization protein n=1 Tax=Methanoregula sp. TaxID=2052170 RepID=UPI003C19F29A
MAKTTQYSAVNLIAEAGVDPKKWNILPAPEVVERTIQEIEKRGIKVIVAENGAEALSVIKKIIPPGAEVMNGSSTTLIEIGYEEFIATGQSGWNPVHKKITAENDAGKRAELRRKSVAADYFISGANAVAGTGEIVGCDAGGSRVGAWPFAAGHLILVVGTNKIVPTLHDALDRIHNYAYQLENARATKAYGTSSVIGKCVILAHEKSEGRVTLILVKEALGY